MNRNDTATHGYFLCKDCVLRSEHVKVGFEGEFLCIKNGFVRSVGVCQDFMERRVKNDG